MNDNKELPAHVGVPEEADGSNRLPDSQGYLGRRIEPDGSWTMYHVFTGIPARVDNRIMTGLTAGEVTDTMVRRNADSSIK